MMKKLLLSLSAIAFAGLAQATLVTIDFNSIGTPSVGNNVYSEDGFTFTATGNHFDSSNSLAWHDGGANPGDNDIILDFGGSAFDIVSFDLITASSSLTMFANDGQTMTFNAGSAAGNYTVGLFNVTSVMFEVGNGTFNLDNLVLNTSPASVPEPASLALLGLGLAGIGLNRKRKQA